MVAGLTLFRGIRARPGRVSLHNSGRPGFRDKDSSRKVRFDLSACAFKCDVLNMSVIADRAIAWSDPQRAQGGDESRKEQELLSVRTRKKVQLFESVSFE
jgi:hypothetical protein